MKLINYLDSAQYRKDSIICIIMGFNPLLPFEDLFKMQYVDLEKLCEEERIAYNKRVATNQPTNEKK